MPSGIDPFEVVASRLFQTILRLCVTLAGAMVKHADLPLLMENHLSLQS